MSIPRIRKDFKLILKETQKAILFKDFDGKEYWIPKSICTLIKQKKGKVVVTLAVFKFEEITGVEAEPLETTFANLGGKILSHHTAKKCDVIESKTYPLLKKQRKLVKHHINSKYTAWLADAGTGKTLTTLTIAYSRWRAKLITHTVVFCPASLQKQWKELTKEYFPDFDRVSFFSIHGTSTDTSLTKISAKFNKIEGDIQLIIDESHLIRNQTAKRSRNIEKIFRAEYVQIATAFHIERNAGDLFFQFGVMSREIINEENYNSFVKKFLLLGGADGEQVVAYQNTGELSQRVSPYIARMTLQDVYPELQDIKYKNIFFKLNKEQRQAYNALENLMAQMESKNNWIPKNKRYMINTFLLKLSSGYVPKPEEIDGIFKDLNSLGEGAENLRKISAIAFNPHNNRIKKLREILRYIGDEQCIIWCSYVDEIKTIHKELPNSKAIYGDIKISDRNKVIDDFKKKKFRNLIISIAINEGFNLQQCSNAILYTDNYSRTKRENAIKRIHRIGQTKQCYVYRLIAERSIDMRILATGKRKDKICKIFDNEDSNIT